MSKIVKFRVRVRQLSLALFLVALAVPGTAQGEVGLNFNLSRKAWNATDIVVATEGASVDGILTILESWKGTLQPGNIVEIGELREFASEESRTVRIVSRFQSIIDTSHQPVLLSGQRLILFLSRPKFSSSPMANVAQIPWRPAPQFPGMRSFGSMKESVVWIEDKRVYYWNNPNALTTLGTGRLHASPSSEEGLSKQVSEILLVQEALVEISNEPNVNIRVDRAAKYYDSDVRLAGRMALAIISDVGEPALPTLCRLLLANEKHSYRFGELIPAMAKAGGLAVAPDFVEIIEEELAFWRTMSPTLPVGWQSRYSDYDKSEANRLRIRINNLSKVLYSLKTLRYEDSRDIVVTLRDYWAIEPKLAKLDKVIKESDALLDALDRPAR